MHPCINHCSWRQSIPSNLSCNPLLLRKFDLCCTINRKIMDKEYGLNKRKSSIEVEDVCVIQLFHINEISFVANR